MTPTDFLTGVFATWALIGLVSAIVMGRRGYAPFSWLILGALFGPLVVPLAVSRHGDVRRLEYRQDVTAWKGPVDVLVGIDGSPESIAAANVVARLIGDRIGRLTLATVLDYDTALGGDASLVHRAAKASVDRAAAAVASSTRATPEVTVLAGRPAEALSEFAAERDFDVLAVGSRGAGASKLMMGSVATRLSRGVSIPVLTVSGEHPRLASRSTQVDGHRQLQSARP